MNDRERMDRVEAFMGDFLRGMVAKGIYTSTQSGIGRSDLGNPDFVARTKGGQELAINIRFRQGLRPASDQRTDSMAARYPAMRILHVEDIEQGILTARSDRGASLVKLIKDSEVGVLEGGMMRIGNFLRETMAGRLSEGLVLGVMSGVVTELALRLIPH